DRTARGPRGHREARPSRVRRAVGDMLLCRIDGGRDDGVEVRHIVSALANAGDISRRSIGNIKLFESHSPIELQKGMPGEVLQHMQLLGDAVPHAGGERRGGGRSFSGERRGGGRNFSGGRREGGRGDGRR
ncbi:DbpA RNA binding domain-containing protein, partial [Salmonella enterica]|uniref:DbpA RNA binding domain-containing protein n=1 Tax=Salmonella enterica TaxID=28901 RepID=UPI000B205D00